MFSAVHFIIAAEAGESARGTAKTENAAAIISLFIENPLVKRDQPIAGRGNTNVHGQGFVRTTLLCELCFMEETCRVPLALLRREADATSSVRECCRSRRSEERRVGKECR